MWRSELPPAQPKPQPIETEADVCLIAEGCYPYVAGGVSTWVDWLIRSHPHLTFNVLAILPGAPDGPIRYAAPDNLRAIHHLLLDDKDLGTSAALPSAKPKDMAKILGRLLSDGSKADLSELIDLLGPIDRRTSLDVLMNSRHAWETMCHHYNAMPHAAFLGYFWAWRTLIGGLYRVLTCPLPSARVYHAVSTGYAGLVGARAAIETGRPFLITEHGIYSNERRIEILMADWIANSVDNGLDLLDDRRDIREFWALGFESFARVAYSVASEIVALYEANQIFQGALGAEPEKLKVIPNGVDIAKFGAIKRDKQDRPTVAFIGRVTPIKDVQTFIDAVEQVRETVPDVHAYLIGPMDEDPDYADSCIREVHRRRLSDTITFTGAVNVKDFLGRLDLVVLTSISEALPLVILEAGAAGIPCVATDVGACREILEGRDTAPDGLGKGGIVTPVGASEEIAAAIASLLTDEERRAAYGAQLQRRVATHYRGETVANSYTEFYARNLAPQSLLVA